MKTILKSVFAASLLLLNSCSDDDDNAPVAPAASNFVLGVGVTDSNFNTSNFVLATDNVMSGTISLQGQGILQDGYRDYATGGNTFYSIGGLGVTDVNAYSIAADSTLQVRNNLTFPLQIDGFREVDDTGNTMVGISVPQDQTANAAILFYTVDIATNTIETTGQVPFSSVNPDVANSRIFTTGMQVSGDKLYQTFYLINRNDFNTPNTDTQYVAIYNYPEFTLDTVISDTRFGPAGAFNTRSGIFTTANGDLYTVSNSNFGFTQATKPAGILRIPAGTTSFDPNYTFNTETTANGGKIIHAISIGNGRLFAAVSSKVLEGPDGTNGFGNVYSDTNLRLAIVDLLNQTITPVSGAPEYTGNGGRSFAAFQDGNLVYSSIADDNGVVNIYRTNINTATATKGAVVEGTFVGGIAKIELN